MIRRSITALLLAWVMTVGLSASAERANAQQRAYGRVWGYAHGRNWERFYHYPYLYYPQNYWGNEYYRSSEDLYHRYPPEMRIPVYNKKWHNYYPSERLYHWGHQFILDAF